MGVGLLQLVLLIILGAIFVFPMWRILSRMGFAGAWSLVMLIPFGGLVLLWVLAYAKWPMSRGQQTDVFS